MFSTSDPTTYQMVAEALWPLKLAGAIVCAYLVHEWITTHFDPPEDPDCPA